MIYSCVKYLNETVSKFPNKSAIIDEKRSVTFCELQKEAYAVSNVISHNSVNKPIAVFLPKSIDCVKSFIGVLYSANFYVPLDVKSPLDRVLKVLDNLNPEIIITNSVLKNKIEKYALSQNIKILNIDEIDLIDTHNKHEDRINKVIDTDPIYCIYTSGSTGIPKGVLLSHRSVNDFIDWVGEKYELDENTILGNQSPFLFDVSVIDIYICLKKAATLHIIPEMLFSFPVKLLDYVIDHAINFIIWVPSVLMSVANANALNNKNLIGIKKVLFAGEVMPNKHLNYWRRNIPDALFSNLYGPTETAVIATYYIIDRAFENDELLPIGFPCENIDVMILDESNKVVEDDNIGELCVRGSALAYGYWNDKDKTDSAFVQNPLHNNYRELVYRTGDLVRRNSNNEILYVGRKDSQIKHMGYRIELGEIENTVLSISNIENACVLYNVDQKQICLFFESKSEEVDELYIRKQMLEKLPKYMLPSKIVMLKALPLNNNGKIDRNELKNKYLSI